jgi:uncharacterized protein YjbI with pentapeptide repeats
MDCRIQGCTGECVPTILSGKNFEFDNVATSNFAHTNLKGASFYGANASAVNFSYADLSGVNFNSANLAASDFSFSRCIGCDFREANLAGVKFSGAIVSSPVWDNTYCPDGTNSDSNGTAPESCKGHGGGL